MRRIFRRQEHPYRELSPMPLMVVILGYWFPLEWALRGWAFLGNTTAYYKLQVLGTSVLFNFLPALLIATLMVYVGSLVISLFRLPYGNVVRYGMNGVANLLALTTTALAIKLLLIGPESPPTWSKFTVLFCVVLLAAWLTRKSVFIAEKMFLPRVLMICLIPFSFVVSISELIYTGKREQNTKIINIGIGNSRPPDILLVTIDALSSSHLPSYGYSRNTAPNLSEFSLNAIRFESFYANANWTRPGIASILNGARPWTHNGDLGLPLRNISEKQNLLGCLARAGYAIRTVSSNAYADHIWQGTPIVPTENYPDRHESIHSLVFPNNFPSS